MPNLKTGGQVGFMPAPDAIQEFRVVMNAYDSSIGRQAGGTIQMVTKSGTAKLHGSLYEFNQNNVLNANTFQSNLAGIAKAPIHYNEYGGTVGGPVWLPKVYNGKQKTFFFFAYDGTRNQDPRSGTRSVLTSDERKGDFSQTYTTTVTNGVRTRIPDPDLRSLHRGFQRRAHTLPRHEDPHQPAEQGGAEHPQLRAAAQYAERWHQHRCQQFHTVLQPPE